MGQCKGSSSSSSPSTASSFKLPLLLLGVVLLACSGCHSYEGPWYDSTAYSECKTHPEPPLYGGGLIKSTDGPSVSQPQGESAYSSPAFLLSGLTKDTRYTFSCWVKVINAGNPTTLIKARLSTEAGTYRCVGSVLASSDCWSFLKGGFVLDGPSNTSILYFQGAGAAVDVSVASASLQPFTPEQWKAHQDAQITTRRKRAVTIHVSDAAGVRLPGANVTIQQLSKDFPFGSAISKAILNNPPYQSWFLERFNAAVFENELKWYATEPDRGRLNYTLADAMLAFVHSNQIDTARGHNIFWEDPVYTPAWVKDLNGTELLAAVTARIKGLMTRYSGEFAHWDVNNEMLHFDFYEQRLGPNASLALFHTAQEADPLATLFMNDFNVIETCDDDRSTVDSYIRRLRDLVASQPTGAGQQIGGIGLEGHFTKPNPPLVRAILDKLATLGLPIWLTEIDISRTIDPNTQAVFLEQVLREGYAHPAVNGIMLWTALNIKGECYQMCLTDTNLKNRPVGDVVDRLLAEWETKSLAGVTDGHGTYSFSAYLGEYKVGVNYGGKLVDSSLSLNRGTETRHLNVQIRG